MTRTRGRLVNAIVNLFEVAARGDYVVVPTPLDIGLVRIGVFRNHARIVAKARYPRRYGEAVIPARRVDWLPPIREHLLSPDLSGRLRHQHPFSLLEKSHFVEVLSFVNSNFITDEKYIATIFNREHDYTNREMELIGLVSQLAGWLCQDIENGVAFKPSADDLLAKLLTRPSIEYSCAQSSDIHSPGFNRFVGARITGLAMVAILGALIGLANVDGVDELEKARDEVVVVNTLAPDDDPCTATVSEATSRFLKMFSVDQLWEKCKDAKESETRAGINPGIVVED